MTTANTTRRGGFTLIELLVVISIIIVLGGVSAGAYFRIRAAQAVTATESNMQKLNSGIDKRWKGIIDEAKEEVRDEKTPEVRLMVQALANKELVLALWTHIKLRFEFPTTFREAQLALPIPPQFGSFNVPPRKIFAATAGSPLPATGGTPEEQSAACLYIALTATGNRGETFDMGGNQAVDYTLTGTNTQVKLFVDSWGKPIAFCRMGYSVEVQNTPYTKVTSIYRDPVDPAGQIEKFAAIPGGSPLTNRQKINLFWAALTQYHMTIGGNAVVPTAYSPQNWVPTTISSNADRAFAPAIASGIDTSANDLLSYRLRREGTKGD